MLTNKRSIRPTVLASALALALLAAAPAVALGQNDVKFRPEGRPYLGVWTYCNEGGMRISAVVVGSPAHRAGLLPGNLILSVNGRPVGIRDNRCYPLGPAMERAGNPARFQILRGRRLFRRDIPIWPSHRATTPRYLYNPSAYNRGWI